MCISALFYFLLSLSVIIVPTAPSEGVTRCLYDADGQNDGSDDFFSARKNRNFRLFHMN